MLYLLLRGVLISQCEKLQHHASEVSLLNDINIKATSLFGCVMLHLALADGLSVMLALCAM